MGNMQCPAEDAAHLADVARVICPFPSYTPNPYFSNMLNINSSQHLKDHYTAVQRSLTPKQLEDFTQGLKTTFGRKGKVTQGGVGVVALALAVLFDTLAKTVKGEWVSESEPIPGLFVKDPRGYYPPHVYTISKYLRLVPYIANNPTRMKQETERSIKHLVADLQVLNQMDEDHTMPKKEDVTIINTSLGYFFSICLQIYFDQKYTDATKDMDKFLGAVLENSNKTIGNFNCDPEMANTGYLAELEKSDKNIKEAIQECRPKSLIGPTLSSPNAWLLYVRELTFFDGVFFFFSTFVEIAMENFSARKEDFDLKANALGKWE